MTYNLCNPLILSEIVAHPGIVQKTRMPATFIAKLNGATREDGKIILQPIERLICSADYQNPVGALRSLDNRGTDSGIAQTSADDCAIRYNWVNIISLVI